jgi:ABC-type transporter Mla subunit MlaD
MKSGAVVRVAGKDVGKVTSVELSGALVEVAMVLNEDVRPLITGNSKASIGSLSLLGEPIIEIWRRRAAGTRGERVSRIRGRGSPITELANQAKTSLMKPTS